MLTRWRTSPETAWLAESSCVVQQQALRDLQAAYVNFFEKRARYPRFRRRETAQSVAYVGNALCFDPATKDLSLAKIGVLKVRWSRPNIPLPSSLRLIRRSSGRYFVSLVVDVPESKPLPKTNQSVGIDFGINRLATLSTGEFIANPKYGSKYARRLARLQRELARKQKGSKRRECARRRVARAYERIANCREDTQNKLALNLVRRFDTICVEDLNLRGMVQNHRLARALSDASIGNAIRKLESKAVQFGKNVIRIDRFFPSSKQCSACGTLKQDMSLDVRNWTCDCGAVHDRDVNAAKNILAVGQTVFAHGAGVRAKRTTVRKANRRRSANRPRTPET